MIQDWCIQHNKIPDTQDSFYLGKDLQPLFILRHLMHAAQKMLSGSSRLYAAFLTSKKLTIVFQETSYGAFTRCLTISCPS